MFDHTHRKTVCTYGNSVGVALSRRRYLSRSFRYSLDMLPQEATKRLVAFLGFALCGCVCRIIFRERALGYSPPPTCAPA